MLINVHKLSDPVVFCVVLASTAAGALLVYFTIDLGIGVCLLSLAGGMSAGFRLVLVKKNLLISNFVADWVVIGLLGFLGTVFFLWRRNLSMVVDFFLNVYTAEELIGALICVDRWLFPCGDILYLAWIRLDRQ